MLESDLKVVEVTDFRDLKGTWNSLLSRNLLGDNIFLTWEWLSTWWKNCGEGRKLLLLLVKDGDDVSAIAPLMFTKYRLPGFGAVKKIEFLGTRHSDYSNLIVLKRELECLRLIVNYLMDTVPGWNLIELKEIPETLENAAYLQRMFSNEPPKLKLKKRVSEVCPYISLPASFELLMKGLTGNLRKNLNRYLKTIRKEHRVELRRYDEAGFSVKEAMNVFIRLNAERWALEGQLGSFKGKEDSFRNFHMDVAECLAQEGWLGLYFLTVDDEPASVQYAFEYKHKMYYYLGGFDPQYLRYSVGNLIIMLLLQRCIQKGFKEYDMMRGGEFYKKRWTNTYRNNFEIRLVRDNGLSRFYDWVTWNKTVYDLAGKLKLSLNRALPERGS